MSVLTANSRRDLEIHRYPAPLYLIAPVIALVLQALLPRLAQCFLDGRAPARIQHSVAEMISQRVAALALCLLRFAPCCHSVFRPGPPQSHPGHVYRRAGGHL